MLDASAQHAGPHRPRDPDHRPADHGHAGPTGRRHARYGQLTPSEADRRGRLLAGHEAAPGIAAALIGDPQVLILDEPANGLDPAGIRWMRDLLRDHADHGGTVLLSSHLLTEVEIVADDIVMIGQGRIVCQGSKADLLRAARDRRPRRGRPGTQRALTAAGIAATARATVRCAPTRIPPPSAARPTTAAWCSPSSALPTAAALRRCSSSSPPTPNETPDEREDRGMTAIASTRSRPVAVPRPRRSPSAEWCAWSCGRCSTRSGFWLIASIAITGLIATIATIAFAPDADLTYYTFAKAIGFPITVILPMVALLDHQRVEPAQRPDDLHPRAGPTRGGQAKTRSPSRSDGLLRSGSSARRRQHCRRRPDHPDPGRGTR